MREENRKTGPAFVAEGAVLAALAAVLGLVGIYLPPLRILVHFVWMIPLIFVTMRWGVRKGALVLLVTGALITLLSTPVEAVLLLAEYGALALVYGYAFRRMVPLRKTLLWGVLTAGAGAVLVLGISMLFLQLRPADLLAQLNMAVDSVVAAYEEAGFFSDTQGQGATREQLEGMSRQISRLMLMLIPSILVMISMATAIVSLILARGVFHRLRIPVPEKLPPFRQWRFDYRMAYGFIAGLILFLGGETLAGGAIRVIGSNLLVAFGFLFLIQGLAVTVFVFRERRGLRFAKIFLVVLALIYMQFTVLVLFFVGLFDLFFDYRKAWEKRRMS